MSDVDVREEEGMEEEEFGSEEEGTEEQVSSEETQVDESAISRIIARERTKTERMLKKLFGTSNLETASQYYKAGQAVTQASGKTPQEVLQRLSKTQQQQGGATQGQVDPVSQELQEIRDILSSQREEEVRGKEEAAAKKEFGDMFTEHEDDIRDMADERGLSLVDAAAVVLRPHLNDLYSKRAKTKQEVLRKKKVESSDESPGGKSVDPASALSAAQKRTAQKMRMSYKDYYEQLKELGRI